MKSRKLSEKKEPIDELAVVLGIGAVVYILGRVFGWW